MPHSPANSLDSLRTTSPVPAPFHEWFTKLTPEMLEPRGPIPEFEPITRRNSSAGGSRIKLRRQLCPLQISNAGLQAQVAIVVMSISPPDPPGGRDFEVHIPWQWWRTHRRRKDGAERAFTCSHIQSALKDEIMARVKGEGPVHTLTIKKYAKELREEVEDCIKNLPSAAFTLEVADNGEQVLPTASHWQNWTVEYGKIHETTVDLCMHRGGDPGDACPDVEITLQLPLGLLQQSPNAVTDWVLIQIGL